MQEKAPYFSLAKIKLHLFLNFHIQEMCIAGNNNYYYNNKSSHNFKNIKAQKSCHFIEQAKRK